ncbi:MAG TPA: glycosyltransferase family 39 protein [Myxococcota bacterium]|nr:glycosyltransferase family 39 protein [Myxococcota bacterium]
MVGAPIAARGESRRALALPIAAAVLFAVLALDAARRETPTIDEFAHVPAGYANLATGRFDVHAKNPPLAKMLLALPGTLAREAQVPEPQENPFAWGPWRYGHRFMEANTARYFRIFFEARAVVVAFALLTAALIFAWGRALFGASAAAIATALFLLSPDTLAHGHLATLDMACALAVLTSAFAVRAALRTPALSRWLLAGAVWGAALLVKFTALLLAPGFALLALVARWPAWRRGVGDFAALVAAALLVSNLGMLARGTGTPLGQFHFGSDLASSLQSHLPGWLPVPLPRDYVSGYDAVMRDIEHGEFPSYLRGHWSREGWWYYEAVALAVKMPEPFVVMLCALPIFLARARLPRREILAVLAPLFSIAVPMTALNHLNIGLRYLLPAFPFLYLLLGSVFARPGRPTRVVAALVLAYYAGTALVVHPAHLAYFNPLSGGPAHGHQWLLDSNLDWGQDLYRVPAALEARGIREPIWLLYFGHVDPRLYGIDSHILPREPVEGVIAVSVSYLAGFSYPVTAPDGTLIAIGADHAHWLRRLAPIARLGSIWLYDTRRASPTATP